MSTAEHVDTVVVGGGQSGLALGYYLAQQHRDFVILDAHQRVGDAWRTRWDSLRLFTPAKFDGLPGMRFPADPLTFPTKDQQADYLEAYAARFDLPVRCGVAVEAVSRESGRFVVAAGASRWLANSVVLATGGSQVPKLPGIVESIAPEVRQLATPLGRKAAPAMVSRAAPLIRTKMRDLAAAGVRSVPRVSGVRDGMPVVDGDSVLSVANIIWCTGYRNDFSWVNLPGFEDGAQPPQARGMVESVPGLYFLGQEFQFSAVSATVTGVCRDAKYLAGHLDAPVRQPEPATL